MEQHQDHLRQEGHGMLKPGNTLHLRWNSQVHTACFINRHDLKYTAVFVNRHD